MSKHKFKVGQWVTLLKFETTHKVEQRRIENGHLCYRLDSGQIVNEIFLS